jgi:hypothetical protein
MPVADPEGRRDFAWGRPLLVEPFQPLAAPVGCRGGQGDGHVARDHTLHLRQEMGRQDRRGIAVGRGETRMPGVMLRESASSVSGILTPRAMLSCPCRRLPAYCGTPLG